MKTKLLFFLIALVTCICFALAMFCFLKSLILFSILIFLVAIFTACTFVGMICYRCFMRKKIMDPKIDLKRNYDRILLGEISKQERVLENTLDLRGYHRNAYTDILLAERYYSFLKQNGCIDLFVSNTDYYIKTNKINPIDYPLIHPVTLLEHGIPEFIYKYALLNPMIGLMYFFFRIGNPFHWTEGECHMDTRLEPLACFCEERRVCLIVHSK